LHANERSRSFISHPVPTHLVCQQNESYQESQLQLSSTSPFYENPFAFSDPANRLRSPTLLESGDAREKGNFPRPERCLLDLEKGGVTSQNIWSPYDRHFLGITWCNVTN